MIELWDAYDNTFNKIKNMTLVRGESLQDGETIDYKWVDQNTLFEMSGRHELVSERMIKLIRGLDL